MFVILNKILTACKLFVCRFSTITCTCTNIFSVPNKKWSDKDMADAVNAVHDGMSVRRTADQFNIPKSPLSDRVTGRVKPSSVWVKG